MTKHEGKQMEQGRSIQRNPRRRYTLAVGLLCLVTALGWGVLPADAAPKDTNNPKKDKITQADRQAAAARAKAAGFALPTMGVAAMQMPGEAPYYFSVPNYANSPLRIAATATTSFGNPRVARGYPTDTATNVLVINTTAPLPTGTLTGFETYAMPGGAGSFHAYVLRPTGTANEYSVVFDSGALLVPDVLAGEVRTFTVGPFAVQAGDVIAHYGNGIALDIGNPTGRTRSSIQPVRPSVAPAVNTTFVAGSAEFPFSSPSSAPTPSRPPSRPRRPPAASASSWTRSRAWVPKA